MIKLKPTLAVDPQPLPQNQFGNTTTNSKTIKNGVLLAEGPGSHSWNNYLLMFLLLGIPLLLTRLFKKNLLFYLALTVVMAIPILMTFWSAMSTFGSRLDYKVKMPNKDISEYFEFTNIEVAQKYKNEKIPLAVFQELFINGLIVPKNDLLDILEYCHDWGNFRFTLGLFKYFLLQMMPQVLNHSRNQDKEQVRGHYDRGDDFYAYFLGPRMIYTSGIISDPSREESLEELQDTKLKVVCNKIELKQSDQLLDIGCGWGTLVAYATALYGCKATGITLCKNQCAWGNKIIENYAGKNSSSEIKCLDYRDIPKDKKYNKITCLEMAEHVGVLRLSSFMKQIYDILEEDGIFYLQIVTMRKCWQFEDLIWGLFMNKYIFPGADATLPIDQIVGKLTGAGFEIKSADNITIHYSATIWRWYRNWKYNKDKVTKSYGVKWYKTFELFLAWSVIASRQGSAHCFQIVCHKDKNAFHRINGVSSQEGLKVPEDPEKAKKWKELNRDQFN